jgi:uncharacterized protein
MDLSPEQIAEYLLHNPDFFEEHITLLTDVAIPHPHGGRTVSISERQVLALREKNRILETKLSELLQFGEENDALSEKIHRLACALIAAKTLDDVLRTIDRQMRDNFFVPHALVRLWHPSSLSASGRPEAEETTREVRDFVAAMKAPYCGYHAVYETNRWFGDAAPHLKSFAMVALRGEQTFGVLLMASEDAQRFYPGVGTLYLTRIGELVGAAVQSYFAS